ncbi:MAG TPA: secretin N-terminal domain-containing protein [Acidiferrobacterales bacterium]|nr:secretin N-terminal domain-containing protein [Acidiferrobacterales bacterium]
MTNRIMKLRKFLLGLFLLCAGCAGPIEKAEQYSAQDEWLKAVIEYRKAYSANPRDVEYRSRLKQVELKAADYYYQRGMGFLDQDNVDAAILQFQQGLAAMSDHAKLQQAMNAALARKEANNLYLEGVRTQEAGKNDEAKKLFKEALQSYPDHKLAAAAYAALQKQDLAEQDSEQLALSSKAPITLNFRQTDLRTAFEFIAKSFGLNVIFDEGIKNAPVTLFAKDVTFEQALNLMFTTNKTFYKKIGPNTIIIIPDTKEKRGQYEDHLIRAFQLNRIKAKDMNEILKGVIAVKKTFVNEELNTLVVRDTEDVLKLVEKLIQLSDRKPAEMILEVEILEVNRSKAEKLGLDLGTYQVSASVPATVSLAGSVGAAIQNAAVLTLPSATFRFFKQDVDAKTLANPKIRVLNGKAAKIHVGDRVPLRAATITDATGQVRTTYDYKEIGIKLTAEPIIHLDNSATVKLGLEVSALGANVGTANEPAFSIGTRNAETVMLLRDGETAILGGLIRDEDRHAKVRVPVLGDIPVLGSLFSAYDNSADRTDVLLTITPRVVRSWDLPPKETRQFYSGTADSYFNQALFANMDSPIAKSAQGQRAKTAVDVPPPVTAAVSPANPPTNTQTSVAAVAPAPVPVPLGPPPLFTFSESVYDGTSDRDLEIQLLAENLSGPAALPIEVLFNPQLLKFVRGEAMDFKPRDIKTDVDEAKGVFRVSLVFADGAGPKGKGALARVVLHALKPGISYLVYKTPALKDSSGGDINAQVRASRVVIK